MSAALAYAIAREWDGVRRAVTELEAWRLVAAGVAALAGVGVSGQVWRVLTASLGGALTARAAAQIFFVGQLGKYLPGSVWPVLAQMELGRDHGLAPRTSAAAVVLFLWVHLCTGGIVACLLLPLGSGVPDWIALGAPLGALLVLPGLLGRVLRLALRVTRRPPLPQLPATGPVIAALGWAAVMWMCYGVHLLVLVAGVEALPPTAALETAGSAVNLWSSTGAFAAAWSVGFLFLVAPAGAGVREAVLAAILPLEVGAALVVVVASRVVLTLADAVWGSIGALSARRRR